MTRLTEQMIRDIPSSLTEYDAVLRGHIGVGLRQLAEASLGANDVDTGNWKVAAVPITSGQGSIGGFSLCISALAHHLGYRSLVTQNTDVSGLHEAMVEGADIIILADDLRFVALNVHSGGYAENGYCTAVGYVKALELAAHGLEGKDVLVIGAGEVGSHAIRLLSHLGAVVSVVEPDPGRAARASLVLETDLVPELEEGVRTHDLILNASPAIIRSEWIGKGTVISSPGVPFSFKPEAMARAKIIHDPLQTGTAVMLLGAALGWPEMGRSSFDRLTMNNIV